MTRTPHPSILAAVLTEEGALEALRKGLESLERARATQIADLQREQQRLSARLAKIERTGSALWRSDALLLNQDHDALTDHFTDRLADYVAAVREIPEVNCAQRGRLTQGFRLAMPDGHPLHSILNEMHRLDIPALVPEAPCRCAARTEAA
jgi:hypothetical protein